MDLLIENGEVRTADIEVGTEEFELYNRFIFNPEAGHKIIGKGEASAIALAKVQDGILASNNLKDINQYVKEYNLKHYTTGDVLKLALQKGLITEDQGNSIWSTILSKKRKLGFMSFSEYLESNRVAI